VSAREKVLGAGELGSYFWLASSLVRSVRKCALLKLIGSNERDSTRDNEPFASGRSPKAHDTEVQDHEPDLQRISFRSEVGPAVALF